MARKITMFELHFDGARFGPSFGSSSDEAESTGEDIDVESEESYEEESSGSRRRPFLAIVGVILFVTAVRQLAKRRRSSEEEYGIEIDEESEAVAAE